jgi:predicted  nucleic acid-binding Zn-ribbon protein
VTVAAELFKLQSLDTELEAKQGALSVLQGHLENCDGLNDAREGVERARRELRELETNEKDLELQDEELSTHLAAMEKKLYSGSVNNPKELNDLNTDVAMLKRRRQDLDERVLILMDEVEAARTALAAAEEDLQRAEAEAHDRQQSLAQERDQTLRAISELEGKREGQLRQVPEAALGQYDVVRERRRPAVASVDRGVCSGCRVEIPDSLIKEARRQLTFCSSCNRILFVA